MRAAQQLNECIGALHDALGRIQAAAEDVSPGQRGILSGSVADARVALDRLRAAAAALDEEVRQCCVMQDAAPALLSYVDTNCIYRQVNAAYERWFNLPAERIEGCSVCEVLGERAWQAVRPYVQRALAGETVTYEQQTPYHGGGPRWVEATCTPDFDPAGRVRGYTMHVVDEMARKHTELALRSSEAQLQTIIENITDGVVVSDLDGNLVHWNRAALEMHGLASSQEVRRPLAEIARLFEIVTADGTVLPLEQWPLSRILRGQTLRDDEVHVRRLPGGEWRAFNYSGTLVRDAQGGALLAVVTIGDVTARRAAERRLRESETKYRSLFENVTEEVRFWKLERDDAGQIRTWRLLDANPLTLKRWGKTIDEVVGKTADEILGPGAAERYMPIMRKVATEGRPHAFVEYFPKADKHFQFTMIPLGDQLITTGVDITAIKKAAEAIGRSNEKLARTNAELRRKEAALRERAEELQKIMDLVPAAIWVAHDPQCHRVTGNRLANQWFEAREGENVSAGPPPGAPPTPRRFFRNEREIPVDDLPLHRAALSGADVLNVEIDVVVPSGKRLTIWGSASPLRDAEGRVRGALAGFLEISERNRAEAQLRLQAAALQAAANAIVITDDAGTILWVNQGFTRLTGYAAEEAIGQNPRILKSGRHEAAFYQALWQTINRGDVWHGQLVNRRKDGTLYTEEMTITPLANPGDGIRRFIAIKQDVTLQIEAVEALRQSRTTLQESEQRLRAVVNTARDGIVTADDQGIIGSINPAVERIFGYGAPELVGQSLSILMDEPHRSRHAQYLGEYLRTGRAKVVGMSREVVGRRRDGTTFPLELAVGEATHGGKRLFVGIMHDVSERRQLERQILEVSESERARIGRDLHDDVCQRLVAGAMALHLLHIKLAEQGVAEATEAAKLRKLVEETNSRVRHLCHGLHSARLTPGGLAVELEELVATMCTDGAVTCTCECEEAARVADPATATHLYRIAQEAIHNALRHGRPSRIEIRLLRAVDAIVLEVRNDGTDFPSRLRKKRRGIGLLSMRYRADLIGASLDVRRGESGGTVVTCVLPQAATKPSAAATQSTSDRSRRTRGKTTPKPAPKS